MNKMRRELTKCLKSIQEKGSGYEVLLDVADQILADEKIKSEATGFKEGAESVLAKEDAKEETILKALEKRDKKMYEYYKSVFEDDFAGGYPMYWDSEFIKAISDE